MPEPEPFETERLVVRELEEDDLDAILPVYLSNPGYLALTEGSGGEPGRYDLEMLRRDLALAWLTPGRRVAGLFLREGGEAVGVLDWMEESPSDGKPWIGLVIVRADRQRQGLASEAVEGLAGRLRELGREVVRAGTIGRNPGARALARRLGFEPISTTVRRMASEEEVVVLERALRQGMG